MSTNGLRPQLHPPYAPVKGVREFFDRVGAKVRPERIDRKFLQVIGVSAGNEQHVVTALKFLGLIDTRGLPTEQFDLLYLKGPEKRIGLQRLLSGAYEKMFSSGIDLRTMSRAELHDVFVRAYGIRGQMARKATALFALLCSLAGFPLSDQLATEELPRPTAALPTQVQRSRHAATKALALLPQESAQGLEQKWPIVVPLTPEMDEDEMVAFLLKVRRAIARVAAQEPGEPLPSY